MVLTTHRRCCIARFYLAHVLTFNSDSNLILTLNLTSTLPLTSGNTCAQVGMQNSALGALLATLHFPDPLTPVPCAISACTHSIVGSGIAAYWRLSSAGVEEDGAFASEVSERRRLRAALQGPVRRTCCKHSAAA